MSLARRRRRRASRGAAGHTLFELMTVIVIIAVLCGLVRGSVQSIRTGKQARVKAEIDALALALEAYREKYSSYPPCDLHNPAGNRPLQQHVARAFPRYNLANLTADLKTAGVDVTHFRPDQALVFWLRGFSPDASQPFTGTGEKTPLFEFDPSQLKFQGGSGNLASYCPPHGNDAPYVYFDAATYTLGSYTSPWIFRPPSQTSGVATVYIDDVDRDSQFTAGVDRWVNPTTFQLMAAGPDGLFSAAKFNKQRLYPTGTGYDPAGADDDNITNFCGQSRLGDAKL